MRNGTGFRSERSRFVYIPEDMKHRIKNLRSRAIWLRNSERMARQRRDLVNAEMYDRHAEEIEMEIQTLHSAPLSMRRIEG